MSKGSGRRMQTVPDDVLAERWAKAFKQGKRPRRTDSPRVPAGQADHTDHTDQLAELSDGGGGTEFDMAKVPHRHSVILG